MRFKNYKSAIHNFVHSFMSIDYTKSGELSVNILIYLHNQKLEAKATFDFINKAILPIETISEKSYQLLEDYSAWLPDHFAAHNCDLTKLEKLEITILTNFEKAIMPPDMNYCRELEVRTITQWKPSGRNEESIEIAQNEVISESFIKFGIPAFG